MSTSHSKAAEKFLENQTYAKWHDKTFWGVRVKRDKMAYELPEWERLPTLSPTSTAISNSFLTLPRKTA